MELYIEDIYSKKVPEPVAPTKKQLSFWSIAGIEATLFTVAGFGIAIYSAIRTGGLFYIMETLLLRKFQLPQIVSDVFSLSAMITSLGAFELFVLADGFSKGREQIGLKRSNVGLFASLGVIVIAGMFTGLGLIPNLDPIIEITFYTAIAIGTAFAGGLVALYSGQNIGFTFAKVESERARLISEHQGLYKTWRDGAIEAYKSNRGALEENEYKLFLEDMITNKSSNATAEKELEKFDKEYVNFLQTSLENYYKKNNRVLTLEELTGLGISEKYAKAALDKFGKR